jgi:DNA repair protein RecO (recombination protein O)
MPRPLKTQAIVLRSIRYGEADRVLHLYTPHLGRINAIAKGIRRSRSRFGARLEPFFHVHAVLHEGRGELATITSVDTVAVNAELRDHAETLDAAARACDAVARLFETPDPHPEVFRLLVNELTLLNESERHARAANGLAFRLKLLLAAGIVPQLGACATCGSHGHLHGFSAVAGGIVCSSCQGSAFPIDEESYRFLVSALGTPLAEAPDASERALRQVERAIAEQAEHYAHVRLRPLRHFYALEGAASAPRPSRGASAAVRIDGDG